MKAMSKIIGVTLLLGTSFLMAGSSLNELAVKESQLSQKIRNAYMNGKAAAPYYNELIRIHRKIRSASANAEVNDMITFLGLCLSDLRSALQAPRTRANAEIVADLDRSIQEGTLYIRKIEKGISLASR
jgi:hypothetical protein